METWHTENFGKGIGFPFDELQLYDTMKTIQQNEVLELAFESSKIFANMPRDLEFAARLTGPGGGVKMVPGFWAGGNSWRVRVACHEVGTHAYATVCTAGSDAGLAGQEGTFECVPYTGANPLLKHGRLKVGKNLRHLEHADGTPFYWLGDTWWMGGTKRIPWDGFQGLCKHRAGQGYTLVQMVAGGLYPDMEPFDPRGANEAGFPCDETYENINPAYFDMMDRRVACLVEHGLVPCLVGFWGFHIEFAGEAPLARLWKYLSARYGAYPVVWCVAGEPLLAFYGSYKWSDEQNAKFKNLLMWGTDVHVEYWAKMRGITASLTKTLRAADPWRNIITCHTVGGLISREMAGEDIFDVEMIQSGYLHGSFQATKNYLGYLDKPFVESESCYENTDTGPRDVRFLAWTLFLKGYAGFSYGAMGLWQPECRDAPYGPSPHGMKYASLPWDEACKLPGSAQAAAVKKFVTQFRWWEIESHPEWVSPSETRNNPMGPYAAGIPGELRIVFIPGGGAPLVRRLEKGVRYNAWYFDVVSGERFDIGVAEGDANGDWRPRYKFAFPPEKLPLNMDMVLVMEKI